MHNQHPFLDCLEAFWCTNTGVTVVDDEGENPAALEGNEGNTDDGGEETLMAMDAHRAQEARRGGRFMHFSHHCCRSVIYNINTIICNEKNTQRNTLNSKRKRPFASTGFF